MILNSLRLIFNKNRTRIRSKTWNKCVATEFQDPVKISNKIFNDPEKFTIDFELEKSQETT